MNKLELKTIWKLAKINWIVGFVFWIIETIIFLIIDGWHLKPIRNSEKWCDELVHNFWTFALSLTIYVAIYLFIDFIKLKKDE